MDFMGFIDRCLNFGISVYVDWADDLFFIVKLWSFPFIENILSFVQNFIEKASHFFLIKT